MQLHRARRRSASTAPCRSLLHAHATALRCRVGRIPRIVGLLVQGTQPAAARQLPSRSQVASRQLLSSLQGGLQASAFSEKRKEAAPEPKPRRKLSGSFQQLPGSCAAASWHKLKMQVTAASKQLPGSCLHPSGATGLSVGLSIAGQTQAAWIGGVHSVTLHIYTERLQSECKWGSKRGRG